MTVGTRLLIGIAAFGLGALPALATNAVTSFTGGTLFPGFSTDETVGWAFTTASPITVTALGWRVNGTAPTNADHLVGIWNSSGILLGSINVTAGPATDGIWRFVSVPAISLSPGGTYYIGGRDLIFDNDNYVTSVSGLLLAPGLTFVGSAVSDNGSGFAFPYRLNTVTTGGRFGPSFQFDTRSGVIPEPGTWALLIAGFGIMGARLRRRRAAVAIRV